MRAVMKKENDSWTVYYHGSAVVSRESYQVAANIVFYLNNEDAIDGDTECAEVAARILGR